MIGQEMSIVFTTLHSIVKLLIKTMIKTEILNECWCHSANYGKCNGNIRLESHTLVPGYVRIHSGVKV